MTNSKEKDTEEGKNRSKILVPKKNTGVTLINPLSIAQRISSKPHSLTCTWYT